MNIIKSLARLDALILADRPASIAGMRNLISSLREQAEADAQRTAQLEAANQKIVANYNELAKEHAKLKAAQPQELPKVEVKLEKFPRQPF